MPAATALNDSRTTRRADSVLRSASLRRIAIVVQDLPSSTASQLLASLDDASRRAIKTELASLADVDPVERKRAIESFAGSLKRHVDKVENQARPISAKTSPVDDEFVLSQNAGDGSTGSRGTADRRSNLTSGVSRAADPGPVRPLEFLDELNDEELLRILAKEHAQTIAVVLASISPTRAAQLIPRFRQGQRQDVLLRIGRLQQIPNDLLEELAVSLTARVEAIRADRHTDQLRALLGPWLDTEATSSGEATAAQTARHVPAEALAASPRLQAILAEMPAGDQQSADRPTTPHGQPSSSAHLNAPTAATTHVPQHRTDETGSLSSSDTVHSAVHSAAQLPAHSRAQSHTARSTDQIHQALVRLTPRELCRALGSVPTRTAILALCGLPNKTADAAIAILPRPQANEVRRQLVSIGSLELREIDQAKEAVAEAAQAFLAPTDHQPQASAAPTQSASPVAPPNTASQTRLSAA